MFEKITLMDDIKLVCYSKTDQKKVSRRYVIEGALPPDLVLNELDGPLEIESLPNGCRLQIKTPIKLTIKQDCAGTLYIQGSAKRCELEIGGHVLETGEIHSQNDKNVVIHGNLKGKLFTHCPTRVIGNIEASATIHAKQIIVEGIIDKAAKHISREPMVFNESINPDLVTAKAEPKKVQSPNNIRDEISALTRKSRQFSDKQYHVVDSGFKNPWNKTPPSKRLRQEPPPSDLVPLGRDPQVSLIPEKEEKQYVIKKRKVGQEVREPIPRFKSKRKDDEMDFEEFTQDLEDFLMTDGEIEPKTKTQFTADDFNDLQQELNIERLQKQERQPNEVDDESQAKIMLQDAIKTGKVLYEKERHHITAKVLQFVADVRKSRDGSVPAKYGVKSLKLRKHQIEALSTWAEALLCNQNRGYLDCATGVGKTVIMIAMYLAMGRPRTLVLESRCNLISQTVAAFKQFIQDVDIGIFDGTHKQVDSSVTVSTYQSLQAQLKDGTSRKLMPGKYTFVICDEGHNALGKGRHEPIRQFFDTAYVMGCSATVAYNTLRMKGSLQSMQELFSNLIYKYSLQQSIEDRNSPPTLSVKVSIRTELDISAIKKHKTSKNKDKDDGDDYNQKELVRQLNHSKFNQLPVLLHANGFNQLSGEPLLGQTSVVFAIGVDHAHKVAAEFNNLLSNNSFYGGETVAVATDGKQSRETRERIMRKHVKGKIKVLVCDLICGEGYDNPNVKYIYNLDPTLSMVKATQRNRASRLSSAEPNKVATVIDFVFPQLAQITYEQVLGSDVCGAKYITQNKEPKLAGELLTNYEVAPFEIWGHNITLMQPEPAKQESIVLQEVSKLESDPVITDEDMLSLAAHVADSEEWDTMTKTGQIRFFGQPSSKPISVFNIMDTPSKPVEIKPSLKVSQDLPNEDLDAILNSRYEY